MCTCKIVVLVIKPIAFFMSSLLPPLLDLKVPFMSLREAGEIEKKKRGSSREGKREESTSSLLFVNFTIFNGYPVEASVEERGEVEFKPRPPNTIVLPPSREFQGATKVIKRCLIAQG